MPETDRDKTGSDVRANQAAAPANAPSPVDWSAYLALLTEAAHAAAAAIRPYWKQDPQIWLKGGSSPVSEADFAADHALKDLLLSAKPEFNWISEESETQWRDPKAPSFIIDPIDGTRGFLAGKTDWCVSIAITDQGRPVAGVLYQPLTECLFASASGHGASVNGEPLLVAQRRDLAGAVIGSTKNAARSLLAAHSDLKMAPYCASLALRLAAVATGEVDVAIAGANAADWDLAAADLLVQEAGGHCLNEAGFTALYEQAPFRHPRLIASNPRLVQEMRKVAAPPAAP